MSSDSQRVETIFLEALEAGDDRAMQTILDQHCQEDTELRRRVQNLLKAHNRPASILEQPFEELIDPSIFNLAETDSKSGDEAQLTRTMPPGGETGDAILVTTDGRDDNQYGDPHNCERPVGSLLAGRYRIGRTIARGGMGAVVRARDELFLRSVAVKFLLKKARSFPDSIPRFQYEAKITARLQHPGIPPVHDMGTTEDGRPFLAMKLIHGCTLAEYLKARKSPGDEMPRWLHVFEQVAQTVGYAHSRGVIHRDLKPLNVMVGEFGEVQVMDWGLAKELGGSTSELAPTTADVSISPDRTQVGAVLGTLTYMSPEQAKGDNEKLDSRTDVYSLGAILCEILTGTSPHQFQEPESTPELLRRVVDADLSDARAALQSCGADRELIDLTLRCLAAEPAERPADAAEVAQAIAEYREQVDARLRKAETERARSETRLVEQRKRRRIQAALVATVAALFLLGGIFFWWQGRQEAIIARQKIEKANAEQDARDRRIRNQQALEGLLDQVHAMLQRGDSKPVAPLLTQAKKRIEGKSPEPLRSRFENYRVELEMLDRLDRVDLARWTINEGTMPTQRSITKKYQDAFRSYGIDVGVTPTEVSVAKVNKATIKERLLLALETWFIDSRRDPRLAKLLAAIDPDEFRNRARATNFSEALLADNASSKENLLIQPAWFAVAHGNDLDLAESVQEQLLQSVHGRYPNNLSVLMLLGAMGNIRDSNIGQRRAGWCRAALAIDPDNAAAWNNLGVALSQIGNGDEAIAALNRAIALEAGLSMAYNNRGAVLRNQNKPGMAIDDFNKAIQLNPELLSARINLALAQITRRNFDGAKKSLAEALRLAPDNAKVHTVLGVLREKTKDLPGSIAAHRQAVKLAPESAEAHTMLGKALADTKQWQQAIVEYQEAIRIDPKYDIAHHNLGRALFNTNDKRGAIASYREALRLNPKNAATYLLLGAALTEQRNLDGAIAALRAAALLQPGVTATHTNLGKLYAMKKMYPEAIASLRKAIEIGRRPATAYAHLGAVLQIMGDTPGAREALKKAVELNPKKYRKLYNKLPPDPDL